jgi:iron complex outermembrane receptor protein
MSRRRRIALHSAVLLTGCVVASARAGAQEQLPTVEVVGVSPVAGSEIDRDKVPSNVQSIVASDFDHAKSPDLLTSIFQSVPGVYLSDQSGNQFQRNLDYRGFTASPVPGTPQSIAVYQNGTRINEAYGDIVNWDFIPEMAIARMTMQPNNPVFGLNAIGGALSIDMKNGFNYQGAEAQLMGGSYGRISSAAQAGYQNGNYSAYVAADATNDSGWRDFSSASQLRRMYVDLGAKGDQTEFHVSFTGADDHLGAAAATPLELLNQRWSSVYTWPQDTHLQLAFLQANGTWKPNDGFSLTANAYYRGFWQSHTDGNGTDAQPCNDPTLLCIGDGMTPINVNFPVANTLSPEAFLGELDRNQTASNSYGGTLQATTTTQLFDHDNHFVTGVSVDHGRTHFTGNTELGTIDQNLFVQGTGVFIDQPLDDIQPPNLLAVNTYLGIYATDTFDVTSKLSVTAGGRYNLAQIQLQDQSGLNPLLNGSDQYTRFNPVIGATYKVTPNITAYAGYSEANRAPTPLELGCADPAHPCQIDNFLIADPPLKQVVSHTYEAGLRGQYTFGGTSTAPLVTKEKGISPTVNDGGKLSWSLGVFRTENTDDIINIASAVVPMFGYFQNAGTTLRQGVEAKINYQQDRWTAYANYTYVDATYQSALTLQSPNNPASVQDPNSPLAGDIFVSPGDHIPGIPSYRFKAGAEYQITDAWKLGADLNVVGSQYLIHDDANQNPQVPAYWVVNMHTSYQLTKNIELFGLVQNLFNQHYYSAGTFASIQGFTGNGNPTVNLGTLTDPRTFLPGMPLAIYGGMKVKFEPGDPQAQGPFNMARLPVKAPAAAPADHWVGAYVGANGGWLGSISNSISNTGTDDGTGGLGTALATGAIPTSVGLGYKGGLLGGTTGYNWRIDPMWVAGIETDFDGALTKNDTTIGPVTIPGFAPQTTTFSRELDWLGTFRGRLGVTPVSPLLVYATGGLAYGETRLGSNYICQQCAPAPVAPASTANTAFGWTVGAGVEWAFASQWSARAEYLYVDLGTINNFISYGYNFDNGGNSSTMTSAARETENIVRVGVNYKITAGL